MTRILRRLLRVDILMIALFSIGGMVGLLYAKQPPPHETLREDLEPLRSAFNARPDHVRAILLASPT